MKALIDIITEKLILNKSNVKKVYHYHPKDKDELKNLLKRLLKERGNDADLNDIDVSNITDMSWLFDGLYPHNINISEWDVSNVEDMFSMFYSCKEFNCDLSSWDVGKVTDMRLMFGFCEKFEGEGLDNWEVNKEAEINNIFYRCSKLKKPKWFEK